MSAAANWIAAGKTAPILYLPMTDPSTVHINEGTGGNFTLNGTIARSGRGPNQFNVPYSDLDGSSDYLSRTAAPVGIADGKQFTFHCVFNTDTLGSGMLVGFASSTSLRFCIAVTAGGALQGYGATSTPSAAFQFDTATSVLVAGRNYAITVSLDLANAANRAVYINGVNASPTWSSYNNVDIDFLITTTPQYLVGRTATTSYFNGRLGNVFFHTSYIDLSGPANLAKFCTGTGIDCKPVDLGANGELPFGTAPLIYLPMYGNNAGKNYGTGGDFTVNSGPYTGARGPNEFWGNKADFDGTTGYLARTSALSGVSDGKVFSASFFFNADEVANTGTFLAMHTAADAFRFQIAVASGGVQINGYNAAGTGILYAITTSPALSTATNYHICLMIDTANTSKRGVYVNGTLATTTWTIYTNDTLVLSNSKVSIGARNTDSPSSYYNGRESELYFATDYIDFSLEANRLLFRDAFGNPTDLPAHIAAGRVPNPAIYMRFDPANQGKNDGTGGDFTKYGTILDGGQL